MSFCLRHNDKGLVVKLFLTFPVWLQKFANAARCTSSQMLNLIAQDMSHL